MRGAIPIGSAIVALAVVVVACVPEDTPPVKLDESADVLGIDGNGNGVRDDVERVIQTRPLSPEAREQLQAYAADSQTALGIGLNAESPSAADDARTLADSRAPNVVCEPSGVSGEEWREEHRILDALIINTEERRAAYDAYLDHLSGYSFTLPSC